MSMRRQASSILALLLGIFLIISLSRDLQRLLSARDRMESEHEQVKVLEEEQQKLAKELEYVVSDEFIEEEARNKLMMSKPDEIVVLLPPQEEITVSGELDVEEVEEKELANWEKWVGLFF